MEITQSIKLQKTVKLTNDLSLMILFLLFFCSGIVSSVIYRLFGREAITAFFHIMYITLLVIYVPTRLRSMVAPLIVYTIVALIFFFTYLVHPEYADWFAHESYGLIPAIFSPGNAIWAFMIVWFIRKEEKLCLYLKIASWVCLLFYTLQFIAAKHRGYWESLDIDNVTILRTAYSLEFGYNMLMPVSFMGAMAFLSHNKKYYIPYFAGVLMILLGGSRGAVVWPVLMFVFMIPFRWGGATKLKKLIYAVLMILAAFLLILVVYYQTAVLGLMESVFGKLGISSRTLSSLFDGSFSDANGRDQIYAMAIDLIKKGGLFGWGVYGDRYVIGETFQWGYSHNLFLELFVSFGYLGGSIISIFLVVCVIGLYKKCRNQYQQIVFITFLTASMKLMLSNSFWYTGPFWAIIALALLWKRKDQKTRFVLINKREKPIESEGNT